MLYQHNYTKLHIPKGLGDPGDLFSLVLDATCHNTASFPRADTFNPKLAQGIAKHAAGRKPARE